MIAAIAILGACASTTLPPPGHIQAAQRAINSAHQVGVAESSSPELAEAQTKLTAARKAADEKDTVLAQYLAEESQLHAELATIKFETLKAKAINEEIVKRTEAWEQQTHSGVEPR